MEAKNRSNKIFKILGKNLDAIIIKNYNLPFIDKNFFYFTGLAEGIFEGCIAVLFPDKDDDIIVSELEEESAKKSNGNLKIYRDKESYNRLLKESLSSAKNIGLNFNRIIYKDFLNLKEMFSNVKFIDVSDDLLKTRLVKDEIEIKNIRKACDIADKVMGEIPNIIYEGIYEYELAAEINYLMQKNGADKSAFTTISSFGKNSAEPHYAHGNVKLKKGDFILCDFGACYKKYNSDITRTFVYGKSSEKQKAMHTVVLEAQKIGFNRIKPGVIAHKVYDEVKKSIDDTEFKNRFIHSLGHSIGLSVHDGGAGFSIDSKIELKENMVFTVEPGVYIPGLGGVRIEDDILIKEDGIEILTKASRELIEI